MTRSSRGVERGAWEIDRRQFLLRSAGMGATVLTTGGVLAACGSSASTSSQAKVAGTTAGNTVRVAISGAVQGLDPTGASQGYVPSLQAINACHDSLTQYIIPKTLAEYQAKDSVDTFPQLAENWDTSKDTKTVRFHLRTGVKSSFGNELTAADVKYTMDRCLGGKGVLEGAAASQLNGNGVTSHSQIKVIDDQTIEFHTSQPQYRLATTLGFLWFGIYDSVEMQKHATSSDPYSTKWAATNTAGFGPYTIAKFLAGGSEVHFQARPDYWGPQPIPNIIYQEADSPSPRLQLLLAGGAQYAESLSPLQLQTVEKSSNAHVVNLLSTNGARLSVTYDPPFNDNAIRQAIAKALPYEAIAKTVFRGLSAVQPQKSILAPFVPGYTGEFGYATDIAAATSVLSKIKGAKLQFAYNGDSALDPEIAILVQSALNSVGLSVSLKALPEAQYQTEVRALKVPSIINTVDAPAFTNPIYAFQQMLLKTGTINWTGYDNPEAASVVTQLLADPTGPNVSSLVRQGQQIAMRDLPIYPLVWSGDQRGLANGLDLSGSCSASAVTYFQYFKKA
jgi:peptide/nickel transport system substrate-binding protein